MFRQLEPRHILLHILVNVPSKVVSFGLLVSIPSLSLCRVRRRQMRVLLKHLNESAEKVVVEVFLFLAICDLRLVRETCLFLLARLPQLYQDLGALLDHVIGEAVRDEDGEVVDVALDDDFLDNTLR